MTVNYEEIENYLQNGLTEAERTAFEAEMAADPALATAVNLYREIETKLEGATKASAGEAALKQQLAALNLQYFGKKGGATITASELAPVVPMRKRRMLYYVAAAAAVLLVFLWVRPFDSRSKFDAETVYAQFGPYQVSSWGVERSGNAPIDAITILKIKVDSFFSMNPPKYAEALPFLEKITAIDENDPVAALAKAACYTETNDSARAMQTIAAVDAQAKGDTKDLAAFYKAKLYIKYKDIEGCRQALQTITGDTWGGKAKELLKALLNP